VSRERIERNSSARPSTTKLTPSSGRATGQHRTISDHPARPLYPHLNEKDILYLQRTIGNQAVISLLKSARSAPASVQRLAYDRNDGTCIWSDVAEAANKIVMTGKLRIDAEHEANIDAKLDFKVVEVPLSKVDDTAYFGKFRSEKVIEITIVDAKPQGKRIGYVLSYHLGLLAQTAGINYIIAKNVTDARDPFYTPLGFRDAKDEPRWADLVNEKDQIETTIRQNAAVPNLMELLERKKQIVDLMEKNTIFISTANMIANAQARMNGHWRPG
jgi:hypothetical protein